MHENHLNSNDIYIWIPILVLTFLLILYLTGVIILNKSGKNWSSFRIFCFVSGIAMAILALAPPLADYAHHDLRGHMIQHLLIGMLAPLGLVIAAPLTLALKTLPSSKGRKITFLLGSTFFHYFSHPITALFLNIGGMFLLYLTPLYSEMMSNQFLHHLLHFHFLAAGYLFVWAIAGPDPAPYRPSLRLRFVVLFISMATHAYLSKVMYAYNFPRNTFHSLEEIKEAAKLMYYGGDLAEVLLAIAFFSVWYRTEGRRRLNSDSSIELTSV